jgi:hypothetical protein
LLDGYIYIYIIIDCRTMNKWNNEKRREGERALQRTKENEKKKV